MLGKTEGAIKEWTLQVSLDCPFLIAPSVFSNVYFHPAGVTSVSGLSIL
jgi:hypothetical protein